LTEHRGGCHCGNLRLSLRLSQPPEDTPLRACGCSFCRAIEGGHFVPTYAQIVSMTPQEVLDRSQQ
jgi:hypothetical protein